MKEIAEDSSPEVLEEVKVTKMNGTKNGSNNSNDVKYPANCAMRLGSSPDGDDTDIYEPKQNKKIWRILTVLVYVFTVSFGESNSEYFIRILHNTVKSNILLIPGAILLSLYYLFLWDPYKNAGQYPTQSAQASNAPAPPTPQSQNTPTEATPSMNLDDSSTLSDITLNKVVEDLNKGMEPKALALAIKELANKEAKEDKHLEVPLHLFKKGMFSCQCCQLCTKV